MKQRNSFKQPTVRHEMTFSQFVEKLRNCGHISNERYTLFVLYSKIYRLKHNIALVLANLFFII